MKLAGSVKFLLLGLGAFSWSGTGFTRQLQPARFFYERETSAMLRAVRAGMEKGITFNRHYSRSYVSCGLACGTYFFVDRRTGGVLAAPKGSPPREITWDVISKRSSDVIEVIYGPSDGVGSVCSKQKFRLLGHKFVAVDKRSGTRCPD